MTDATFNPSLYHSLNGPQESEENSKKRSTKRTRLLRSTLDTNIYISGIIFGGNSRKILELAKNGEVVVYISASILLEIAETLHYKFDWSEKMIKHTIKSISNITELITANISLDVVKKDPDDNKILECALKSESDYVVTGDKHLLDIGSYKSINIVTPADFLKIVQK